MTDQVRWAKVKELFAAAMERPIADRQPFVQHEAGDDTELRDEVLSLLAAAEGSESMPAVRTSLATAALQSVLQQALGEQYELIRVLGHGGMGAVYLARERALDRFVAIKVLRPELADLQQGRERFRREARVAAQLSHPSIVPLYTFGEIGGVWYFVMRYVRGASLADRLRVEGRVPPSEVRRILIELADALESAHQHGVVHRDIKPANVLLDQESGRAVLADFGISKLEGANTLTESGMIIGTPSYMSPEQAAGAADVDERSDIYSLGAVAHAMLTGREPSVTDRLAGVPDALAAIVKRSLAVDRAQRWASAKALKEALLRVSEEGTEGSEPLRDLPTFGPYAVLWAMLWLASAALPGRPFSERALLGVVSLIVPLGLLLHLWNANDEGIPLGELTRVAFWPPEWWGMWWPGALRRPSDLWPKLPWQARAVRIALSAFTITLPLLILTRRWLDAYSVGAPWVQDVEQWLVWGILAMLLVALGWAFTQKLRGVQAVRLLVGSTMPSAGWKAPQIAALMLGTAREKAPVRDVMSEHDRALRALLAATDDSALRQQVTAAIDHAGTRVTAIDAELETLARDASPGEIDRLTAQLENLKSRGGNEEQSELAGLVQRQIEVVQRLRVRTEFLADERRKMFALLRGLHAQLTQLSEAPDVIATARVTSLCEEIVSAAR